MTSLLVPDASVCLKWALLAENKPYAEQAIALREGYLTGEIDLCVPPLWRYEVGNTLARRYPDEALQQMRDLALLGMHEPAPSLDWLEWAIALARRYAVAFYDCAYHAVAISESGVFVTADERYLNAVGDADAVLHLRDWQVALR